MIRRTSKASLWLRIVCALAVLCLSLVGQPVIARSIKAGPSEAAYMLPDGTIPDLCLDDADGSDHRDLHGKCLACCLPSTFLPPTPGVAAVGAPDLISLGRLTAFAAALPAVQRKGSLSARGPPSILPV
jgi:hypothetical protein